MTREREKKRLIERIKGRQEVQRNNSRTWEQKWRIEGKQESKIKLTLVVYLTPF
jgi:hypothetical protein